MNKFPERLKELRAEKGLSQSALARLTGIDQSTITRYESGEHVPNIDVIIKLCYFFKVTADYIIGMED